MFKKHQLWFGFFIFLFIFFVYKIFLVPKDPINFLYNLVILIFSLFGLSLKPEKYYSLSKIVYFFIFFFFGIIPLNDELKNNIYWGFKPLNHLAFQNVNFVILIGIISFYLGNNIFVKNLYFFNDKSYQEIKLSRRFLFSSSILLIFVIFIILKDSDFNILRLLTRDTPIDLQKEDFTSQFNSISSSAFFDSIIKPFPIIYLLIFHYYSNNIKKKSFFYLFYLMLFPICFIFVAPTSLSRFMVATLYLPFIVSFTKYWDKPYRMQLTLLFSLFFIFPLLNLFRYFNSEEFNLDILKHFDFTFLDSGNFDAYQNFSRIINDNFITYGYQLLGVILFFIPRSIWPNKPYGSGSTLADLNGQLFGNISMPYMAEGYVNFGLLGVIIFMFLLGIVLNSFDTYFWNEKNKNRFTPFSIFYSLLLGLIFFIMRGDLQSSFSYTLGITICFYLTLTFFKKFN